jgi:hypothetical protein
MAITITEDLIQGAMARVTESGKERDRVFYFEGLTSGSVAATAPGIWAEAEEALLVQKGVTYGAVHPTAADSDLVVIEMKGMPFTNKSKTQIKYVVTYGRPGGGGFALTTRVSFAATTREVLTSKHADGRIIELTYTSSDPDFPQSFPQVGRVAALKCNGILVIERYEEFVPAFAIQSIGCTNNDNFQGTGPDTWIMRAVDFESAEVTVGYRVRYAIQYSQEKDFTPIATFRNVFGDTPTDIDNIDDAIEGNGWVRCFVNPTFPFGSLNLPNVFI